MKRVIRLESVFAFSVLRALIKVPLEHYFKYGLNLDTRPSLAIEGQIELNQPVELAKK